MAETMKLQVITPDKEFFHGDVSMVELNTADGELGVYPQHIPLTTAAAPGVLKIHQDGQVKKAALLSGFLQILPEKMKTGSFTMDSGYEMAKELFEEDPSIDSLVCATDTMAVGAMTYLKEIGLRIPDDVQIAGIGDGVPGKIVEPKLTTVHFYYKTSGMEAAAMLADLIENDTGISKEIKMGCELVERESHR